MTSTCICTALFKIAKNYLKKNTYDILIEEIEHHSCKAGVAPVAMDQQQLLKEPKPAHCKVTRHHRLRERNKYISRAERAGKKQPQ